MTKRQPTTISRRSLLMAGAAVPLCGILTRRASAAEFSYKLATGQDPTHPVNVRGQEAIDRIREATSGRLEIKLFPRQPTRIRHRAFDPKFAMAVSSSSISPPRSLQPLFRQLV